MHKSAIESRVYSGISPWVYFPSKDASDKDEVVNNKWEYCLGISLPIGFSSSFGDSGFLTVLPDGTERPVSQG